MPSPKKPNAKKADALEAEAFAERHDTLAIIYGDPIEKVFSIMAKSDNEDTQLKAAEILISYRYPKLRAMEVKTSNLGPGLSITINGAPVEPGQAPLDITPSLRPQAAAPAKLPAAGATISIK